jgi:hypothetical protein
MELGAQITRGIQQALGVKKFSCVWEKRCNPMKVARHKSVE